MNLLKDLLVRLHDFARTVAADRQSVAVLATESVGSVGDQAMLEVMREQLTLRKIKPTFVYMAGWRASPLRADAPVIILKDARNLSPQFCRVIAKSGSMVAIGADVIDGAYGPSLPAQWIGKLSRARQAGVRVGIINFSFSPAAKPQVCELLRTAEGFTFTPRDPVSLKRFAQATGQSATQSADLAFLLTPELRAPSARQANRWLVARKAAGDTILFVNLSGHTLSRMDGDGVAVMEDVLRQWLRASPARSIFLVPHDFRPAPVGDVEVLERLCSPLAAEFPDRVAMIHPPFDAWDVKALCGQADLAITGRMHLAIACLGMGVPVVSVVYVGKFEGVMQHIGLAAEDLLIEPAEALEIDQVLAKIEKVSADQSRLRAIIEARLESVKAMSARNFDWL